MKSRTKQTTLTHKNSVDEVEASSRLCDLGELMTTSTAKPQLPGPLSWLLCSPFVGIVPRLLIQVPCRRLSPFGIVCLVTASHWSRYRLPGTSAPSCFTRYVASAPCSCVVSNFCKPSSFVRCMLIHSATSLSLSDWVLLLPASSTLSSFVLPAAHEVCLKSLGFFLGSFLLACLAEKVCSPVLSRLHPYRLHPWLVAGVQADWCSTSKAAYSPMRYPPDRDGLG